MMNNIYYLEKTKLLRNKFHSYERIDLENTTVNTIACVLECLANTSNSFFDVVFEWVKNVKDDEKALKVGHFLIYYEEHIIVSHTPYLLEWGVFTPNFSPSKIEATKEFGEYNVDDHAMCPKFLTTREIMIDILERWKMVIKNDDQPLQIIIKLNDNHYEGKGGEDMSRYLPSDVTFTLGD